VSHSIICVQFFFDFVFDFFDFFDHQIF
jgi:hypothetical protein